MSDIKYKDYSLDPFTMSTYNELTLSKLIVAMSKDAELLTADNSIELANKIVLLADVQTVIIELVGRSENSYTTARLEAQSAQAGRCKVRRDEWELEHPGVTRYPATAYFDDLALLDTKELWTAANETKTTMSRFKSFRDNYETKINAQKKLLASLEMIRY